MSSKNFLDLFNNSIFCLLLTFILYYTYYYIACTIKNIYIRSLFNPLLLTVLSIIGLCIFFQIDLSIYVTHVNILQFFLPLATILMAVNVYRHRNLFKKYFIIIIISVGIGAFTAIILVPILAIKVFHLQKIFIIPSYFKTITTAFALEVVNQIEPDILSLALFAIILSGILGSIFLPIFIKLFNIKDDYIAWGIAIGTTSHVVGTSTALQINKEAGSVSSVALALSGIWVLLFFYLFQ